MQEHTEDHRNDLPDDALEFAERLFDASRSGNTAFVVDAVDHGVTANLTTATGDTMLMLAAYHGHADLVDELAERGADVNRKNDRGQTPLAGAVFKRHAEVIRVLIARGADLDAGTPSARATAQMFGVDL